MKKIMLALALGLVLASPVFAENSDSHLFGLKDEVVGAKFDAPNLVRFTPDLTLGAEVSKQLNYTASDEGFIVMGKFTYTGSFLDLTHGAYTD